MVSWTQLLDGGSWHHHGVKPTEYDIREIDEDLYLAVLTFAKQSQVKG